MFVAGGLMDHHVRMRMCHQPWWCQWSARGNVEDVCERLLRLVRACMSSSLWTVSSALQGAVWDVRCSELPESIVRIVHV
jgi:hypothetical protein